MHRISDHLTIWINYKHLRDSLIVGFFLTCKKLLPRDWRVIGPHPGARLGKTVIIWRQQSPFCRILYCSLRGWTRGGVDLSWSQPVLRNGHIFGRFRLRTYEVPEPTPARAPGKKGRLWLRNTVLQPQPTYSTYVLTWKVQDHCSVFNTVRIAYKRNALA